MTDEIVSAVGESFYAPAKSPRDQAIDANVERLKAAQAKATDEAKRNFDAANQARLKAVARDIEDFAGDAIKRAVEGRPSAALERAESNAGRMLEFVKQRTEMLSRQYECGKADGGREEREKTLGAKFKRFCEHSAADLIGTLVLFPIIGAMIAAAVYGG